MTDSDTEELVVKIVEELELFENEIKALTKINKVVRKLNKPNRLKEPC